jgi:hypothetical protein
LYCGRTKRLRCPQRPEPERWTAGIDSRTHAAQYGGQACPIAIQDGRVVARTLGQSLEKEELFKATDAVMQLFYGTVLLHLRIENKIQFGWDEAAQEVLICGKSGAVDANRPRWIDRLHTHHCYQ